MGLNMNYTLLTGTHSSRYHIPEYNSKASSLNIYSESYMVQALLDFRQELRESQDMLSEICEMDFDSINENKVTDAIKSGFAKVIEHAISALRKIKNAVLGFFSKIITKIRSHFQNKKDPIEVEHTLFDREAMLNKALEDATTEEATLRIVDINPTRQLIDPNFPDPSIMGNTRLLSDIEDLSVLQNNIVIKDGITSDALLPELGHVENLVSSIEKESQSMLASMFGNSSFDTTNISASAKEVADKAFGSNEAKDVRINRDLYGCACDNIDSLPKLADELEKVRGDYEKQYNSIDAQLNNLYNEITKVVNDSNKFRVYDFKKNYHEIARNISAGVKKGIDAINLVISANHIIFVSKVVRLNSIINDSVKVKNTAHRLMRKDMNVEDEKIPVYNGHNEVEESVTMQDRFIVAMQLIDEGLKEREFSEFVYTAINEAGEGDAAASGDSGNSGSGGESAQQQQPPVAPVQQQQATQSNNNKTNPVKKAGQNILAWLNGIWSKLTDMYTRFKNRLTELWIKNMDKKWWDNNKNKIRNLDLNDTVANDWYKYDLDALNSEDVFIVFDVTKDYMQSDEALQNALISNITKNPPKFDPKDNFSKKITTIYQGGGPVSTKDGQGQKLQNLGYDHAKAFAFVEDVVSNGFKSKSLGDIDGKFAAIKEAKSYVDKNYNTYAEKLKAAKATNNTAAAPTEQSGEPKSETGNNSAPADNQQGTAESAMMYDDFNFNLADWFGLVHREASFTAGPQTQQSVADNGLGGGDAANSDKNINKELDAMIKRFFNYTTISVTSKMTAAIGAYKQYMGLYKYVCKNPKGNTANNNNNGQNAGGNNNQQQNQNQQQQQPAEQQPAAK